MSRPTEIMIDLVALQHNFACVRQRAPHSQIIAMVKSNAYGHGLESISRALPEAEAFGVACLEEGIQLRKAGISQSIVLMEGLFHHDELTQAVEHRFTLVIHRMSQIEMLEKFICDNPFTVWMKIDTGMHRLGLDPRDVQAAWLRLMNCPGVRKPVGLLTHFAEAVASDSPGMLRQLEIFNKVTAHLPGPRSLAKSGAILGSVATHADWVRPGVMLYGVSPWPDHVGSHYGLRPVMSFCSQLIAVHTVGKNEPIGYGGTWICPEDMRVGVVAAGYGDGYPQGAPNGTPVLVNGRRCPIVGRVSMDLLTVDLRSQPEARSGDPVTLWGCGLPVEEIARHCQGSAYELLTRITQRVQIKIEQSPDVIMANEEKSRGELHAIV